MTYASEHTQFVVNEALKAVRLPANVSELTRAIAVKDYLETVLGIEVPLSEVRSVLQQQ